MRNDVFISKSAPDYGSSEQDIEKGSDSVLYHECVGIFMDNFLPGKCESPAYGDDGIFSGIWEIQLSTEDIRRGMQSVKGGV